MSKVSITKDVMNVAVKISTIYSSVIQIYYNVYSLISQHMTLMTGEMMAWIL